MAPIVFQTVFDSTQNGYKAWAPIAIPLSLTGIGALLVFAPNLMQKILPGGVQGKARKVFSWFYFCFTFLFTTTDLISAAKEYYSIKHSFATGEYKVVEGVVTNFVPMPYSGHALESLKVNGVPFSYSDNELTWGFNNTALHGGPIHEGIYVRISYIGNIIIKLELAQQNN